MWKKGLCLFLVFLLPVLSLQKMCPAGFHLSESIPLCTPCTSGVSYTEYENDRPSCLACQRCGPDKEEHRPCTPTRNTECVCRAGTFDNAEHPEMCRKCTGCPEGQKEVSPCTPWNDTTCGDEPHGNQKAVWVGLGVSALVGFMARLVWRRLCHHSNPTFQNILKNVLCVRCRRPPRDPEAVQNVLNEMGTYRELLKRDEIEYHDDSNECTLDTVLGDLEQESPEQAPLPTETAQATGGAERLRCLNNVQPPLRQAPAAPRQAQERRKRLIPARGTICSDTLPRLFYDFPKFVLVSAWIHTMRRLGLSDCEIDKIQKENSDSEEQVYKMLMMWLSKEGLGVSVSSLLEALDAQGQRLAREKIEAKLISSGKFVYDDEGADAVVLRVEDL